MKARRSDLAPRAPAPAPVNPLDGLQDLVGQLLGRIASLETQIAALKAASGQKAVVKADPVSYRCVVKYKDPDDPLSPIEALDFVVKKKKLH